MYNLIQDKKYLKDLFTCIIFDQEDIIRFLNKRISVIIIYFCLVFNFFSLPNQVELLTISTKTTKTINNYFHATCFRITSKNSVHFISAIVSLFLQFLTPVKRIYGYHFEFSKLSFHYIYFCLFVLGGKKVVLRKQ